MHESCKNKKKFNLPSHFGTLEKVWLAPHFIIDGPPVSLNPRWHCTRASSP